MKGLMVVATLLLALGPVFLGTAQASVGVMQSLGFGNMVHRQQLEEEEKVHRQQLEEEEKERLKQQKRDMQRNPSVQPHRHKRRSQQGAPLR